jgi:hypothetical protein
MTGGTGGLPEGQKQSRRRLSVHLQLREAETELPRDAIWLRWEALRELGLALGDTVHVRCSGEAPAQTWTMSAWASGRIPAGCALVPPASGLLSGSGRVELWPAELTPEDAPPPGTPTSVASASHSPHCSSEVDHIARRPSDASSSADAWAAQDGPSPLLPPSTDDAGVDVGPESETLAAVRSWLRPHFLLTRATQPPCGGASASNV